MYTREKYYKAMCKTVNSFPSEDAAYLKKVEDIKALAADYYKSFLYGLNYLEIEYGKADPERLFKNDMKAFRRHCHCVLRCRK